MNSILDHQQLFLIQLYLLGIINEMVQMIKKSNNVGNVDKVYFAHPVSDYGTDREKLCLDVLNEKFKNILNPNQPVHNEAYLVYGMSYFEDLVKSCSSLVAVAFADGEWGMGVWREAEEMARSGRTVFQLTPETGEIKQVDINDIRPLSVNETRRRVKAGG